MAQHLLAEVVQVVLVMHKSTILDGGVGAMIGQLHVKVEEAVFLMIE